jgi:hypothetical protein
MWISTAASNVPFAMTNADNVYSFGIVRDFEEPRHGFSVLAWGQNETSTLLAKNLPYESAAALLDEIGRALANGDKFYEVSPMVPQLIPAAEGPSR